MTRMRSRPVVITQVYPQDTAPSDARDGILWVDTSVSPPKTYTYDADTASWEPVAVQNLYVQDTEPSAPSNGELWVDTSLTPPETKTYDATNAVWERQLRAAELDSHAATSNAHHSRPSSTQTESLYEGWQQVAGTGSDQGPWEPAWENRLADGCDFFIDSSADGSGTFELKDADGNREIVLNVNPGSYARTNFNTQNISGAYLDPGGTSYHEMYVDLHQVSLPAHSHTI